METTHRVHVADSRSMAAVEDASVELVVTSPPYPMIEMWDDTFADLEPAVGDRLDAGDGAGAFDLMHGVLAETWAEVARVLVDGGIACVNVGDATRTVDGTFRVYPNHARVLEAFEALGFVPLPDILWRKPANSAAKFMGSGMLPPNAYATLEHEYLLVFRKGGTLRSFEVGAERRYEAAYFWEERNRWFSDVWADVRGADQALGGEGPRERSGAFPFAVPYRLINMYSVYGDTVLDPFWGTGTTSLAAAVAARDSVGYELDPDLAALADERVAALPARSREVLAERLRRHRETVADAPATDYAYESAHYGLPVRTRQEEGIRFYAVSSVERTDRGYAATHEPVGAEAVPDVGAADDRAP